MKSVRSISMLFVLAVLAATDARAEPTGADLFGQKTTAFYTAMKGKDGATLGQLLADDFTCTSAAGDNLDKQSYVAELIKDLSVDAFQLKPVLVHIYGDAAVAVYHVALKASVGGRPWNPELIATDTWIKLSGTWRMAAHHTTLVQRH